MKNTNWLKNAYIAHRGFHSQDKSIPENSLLAFKKAMNHGYAIELDIHVLKDGQVVVFHDDDLLRMCNSKLKLRDVSYEEIKNFLLLESNEKIPLLTDVLKLIDSKVPLLIELKPKGDIYSLCENFIKAIDKYQGPYAIQSFNPKVVLWFKKNHPQIIRGQLAEFFTNDHTIKKSTKYLLKSLFFNRFSKPDFINYGIKDLPNKYVDKARKKRMIIIGYTATNIKDFEMMKEHYDNSVFEFFHPNKKSHS